MEFFSWLESVEQWWKSLPIYVPILTGGILLGLLLRTLLLILEKKSLPSPILKKLGMASYFFIPAMTVLMVIYIGNLGRKLNKLFLQTTEVVTIALGIWFFISLLHYLDQVWIKYFDVQKEENVSERRLITQLKFIKRILIITIFIVGISFMLMRFEKGKKLGQGLITSAGVASIVIGLAAQRTIANLLAGIQIAFTQPIKFNDVVVVENEWGYIEEINLTYVVVRLWDWRRLVLPINYFLEKPFYNWTRHHSSILGTVILYLDYRMPIEPLRKELERILPNEPYWDGQNAEVLVIDNRETVMVVRVLVGAKSASNTFDLRCSVREKMIAFIAANYPDYLPRMRVEMVDKKAQDGLLL
ncbi:MAG: mechanosensitive ion channel family protein [Flammeovirgaceae bacterium]|nr:mechanosensitive ion channel family protein [Flammeovirgaceae bacterium]MDW8287243.1 mechanosensitive ion channel [Flammeovirgaceae bacterium]